MGQAELGKKSLRAMIAEVDDSDVQVEEVPEWGCTVGIQTLTARERLHLESYVLTSKDENDETGRFNIAFRLRLLAWSLVDPDTHELIFDNTDDALEVLNAKRGDVIERLAAISIEKNSISTEAIEEEEGN